MKGFLSDNTAGVHPRVFEKLIEVNVDHAIPYGYDPVTEKARDMVSEVFDGAFTTFVITGTGANIVAISALLQNPYDAVLCADTSHINVHETASLERIASTKIVTVPNKNGKISPNSLKHLMAVRGNEHWAQPRVISIAQLTEYGTAYSVDEIRALADFAHANDMYLHVDGARIANASVSMGVSFKEMIKDTGVDMLSFGGAKNGLMCAEAVVCFDEKIHSRLKYIRKQSTQLMSKTRFISAQYIAYLENELWRKNAKKANAMMKMLHEGLKDLPFGEIEYTVDGNMLFITVDEADFRKLETCGPITGEIRADGKYEARMVCSFDTLEEEVQAFIDNTKKLV